MLSPKSSVGVEVGETKPNSSGGGVFEFEQLVAIQINTVQHAHIKKQRARRSLMNTKILSKRSSAK
jgi:hypothetical protein